MNKRTIFRLLVSSTVVMTAALTSLTPGCGPYCRDIQTRELDFNCEDGANRFTGELHFDRAATFETFLSQQCVPSFPATEIAALVDGIDWGTEAVFVAVGPPNVDGTRCVETREIERAQVCTDGLKVYFDDTYGNSDFGCAGPRWTVAFALSSDDLRAALEAGVALG